MVFHLAPPPWRQVEPDQVTRDLCHVTGQPAAVREQVEVCQDPYEAARGAHALVICTEWDVFQVSGDTTRSAWLNKSGLKWRAWCK